ncbi:lysozyme inhibitor LprI family protein [Sagittula sp. S175]|uniref:lysozyme inhibitor LprI family protein n=1 Tax=Sagittula sp. S175 TaxID=3415129 RepID=UPI003C7BDAFF
MKRIMLMAALVVGAVPLAGAWAAQELVFSPEGTMQCMMENPGMEVSCIGVSADECMADTEGGGSTVGMGGCLDAELSFWDARLNAAYGARMTAAKAADAEARAGGWTAPSQEEALRTMQRAWIGFRDARCAYAASLWGGGTGAGPATIGCLMLTTGEQALYLENYVR